MQIDLATGLLSNVRYIASPHHSPRTSDIDLLVIHSISLPPGEFGGTYVIDFFSGNLDTSAHPYFLTLANLQVSAHLLIDRAGKIIQFVPFTQKAWHAGDSEFQGRSHCNDFSIGIELEGCDDLLYEEAQYQSLAKVTQLLISKYPKITRNRIIGHRDIAPTRKTDPGPAFNWDYYHCILNKLIA